MTRFLVTVVGACLLGGCASSHHSKPAPAPVATADELPLGNFSVSLTVKDLAVSRAFYEKLGFRKNFGDGTTYVIMQNDTATIGLFQGMFPRNTLTFNPGWDRNAQPLAHFEDVRELQRELQSRGVPITLEADASSTGPAFLMLTDPDGNPILLDQHVDKPNH